MPRLQIPNPQDDISDLLFASRDAPPAQVVFGPSQDDLYIGPICVTSRNVQHGLGVVATRDIAPGECLFITKAAASASVEAVFSEWKTRRGVDDDDHDTATLLEHLAERTLVRAMKRTMESKTIEDRAKAASFFLQWREGTDDQRTKEMSECQLLKALVGQAHGGESLAALDNIIHDNADALLLKIIRRNAFGPDFTSYPSVEQKWNTHIQDDNMMPFRLLGLYPLAAMINHSCLPKAVRVFCGGEYMAVHSSVNIQRGEEILWSYLPPILSFPQRQKQLLECHGFVCQCVRCLNEQQTMANNSGIYILSEPLQESLGRLQEDEYHRQQFAKNLLEWERETLAGAQPPLSNETRRYWKMGHAQVFIQNLNAVLMDIATKASPEQERIRNQALLQAMELHFCFLACHYACTEHLSILHLCYELVSVMYAAADPSQKSLSKVQFWTEQLKRAHLVRYGALGGDIHRVRAILKHTQVVLRNPNGLDRVPYAFI